MSIGDIVVLLCVAYALALAFRSIHKSRRAGCPGCCAACSAACARRAGKERTP